ncbi:MAG: penicillin-binding transpeptidase domain-containing protein, partial [Acidimicrobiia bacterium]
YAGEDAPTGLIDVDEALVRSVNTVFAELGCKAGAQNVEKAGMDAGLPDDTKESYLGGHEQGYSALQQATAYATLAANGLHAGPYAIARIEDREGNVIHEHEKRTEQRFSPEEVGVLNKPLQDVVRRGTGTGAAIGRPVAGKTGTAQDYRDAWFAGYVPQLATAVWVGYPEPKPMDNVRGRAVSGGSFPARIFSALMRKALEGVKAAPIPVVSPDKLDVQRDDIKFPEETTTTSSTSTTVPGSSTTSSSTILEGEGGSSTTTSTTRKRTTTTTSSTTTTAPSG